MTYEMYGNFSHEVLTSFNELCLIDSLNMPLTKLYFITIEVEDIYYDLKL